MHEPRQFPAMVYKSIMTCTAISKQTNKLTDIEIAFCFIEILLTFNMSQNVKRLE